jgi:superfamily II DNA or RNA helicase
MSRFFNPKQKQALLTMANGRCDICGIELPNDWHADHVIPHSKGGPTDVINGQALCPPCNLKKGNRMFDDLRPWQKLAMDAIEDKNVVGGSSFLCVAAPGAGKTRLAIAVAQRTGMRVLHVVPTSSLVAQAQEAYAKFGIRLYNASDTNNAEPPDCHGMVCTYSKLAFSAELMRGLNAKIPTLIVLDELHHAGDEASWGEAVVKVCAVPDAFILVLSGTPWRTDGTPIPFLKYDDKGILVPDFTYDFAAAWEDEPSPIRHVAFHVADATGTWMYESDGQLIQHDRKISATKTTNKLFSPTLRNATIGMGGDFLLDQAVQDLKIRQLSRRSAKGIILCRDIRHASHIADKMRELRHNVSVVHGEIKNADSLIRSFAKSSNDWIIGVNMLGEGVDIPNAEVLVRLDKTTTELFFVQSVGRVIRRVGPNDPPASVYMLEVPEFVEFAKNLDSQQLVVLNTWREPGDPGEPPLPPKFVFDRGSYDPANTKTVFQGSEIDTNLVRELQQHLRDELKPSAPEFIVALMKLAQPPTLPTMPTTLNVSMVTNPAVKPIDPNEHKDLSRDLSKLAYKLAKARGVHPAEINTLIARKFGKGTPYGEGEWSIAWLKDAVAWASEECRMANV